MSDLDPSASRALPARAEPAAGVSVGSMAALTDRLEGLERTVGQVGRILSEHLPSRLSQESKSQQRRIAELASELGAAFRTLLEEARGLRQQVEADVAAAEERVSASVAEAGSKMERRATERATELAARIGEQARDLAELREGLQPLEELPEQFGEGMRAIQEAIGEVAAAHGAVQEELAAVAAAASGDLLRERLDGATEALAGRLGEVVGELRREVHETLTAVDRRVAGMEETVEGVRRDAEDRAARLQVSLERVDKLAEAVESIGRRRGFRHVVAADERFREEQASMTERLSETGHELTDRLEEVRNELEGLQAAARDAQAGLLAEEIRRRVVEELANEEMVTTMVEQARETLERRLDELAALVEARLEAPVEPTRRGLFRRTREQS